MAPVLLIRSEIDDQRWDRLIADSFQQVIYAQTWYLDLVCEDWNALVWPNVEDYRIVMPLPVRDKWSFSMLYQPFFCQYLGLFSKEEVNPQHAAAFLQSCSSRFSYISSYNFHPLNFDVLRPLLADYKGLRAEVRQTVWLSLGTSYDRIANNYSPDRKLNLRRSAAYNWTIAKGEDLVALTRLFKNNHAAKIDGGVSQHAYKLLNSIFENLQTRNRAEVWYASQDGEIHAGAMIVRNGGLAIYLFNSADETGRSGNARTRILDSFFKENSEKESLFDFESPEKSSVFSFYKSFGGQVKPFLSIRKNKLPFPVKHLQELRKFWFRTMRYLFAGLYRI